MASDSSLAHLYASHIPYATTPMEKRKAIELFLHYAKAGTRTRLMRKFNISQEMIAPYLSKSLATKVSEMKPSYPGSYQQLAQLSKELALFPSEHARAAGGGFEALRYANIPENLPIYQSSRGRPGNIPELERHAGQYRGENYYEYVQRLGQAGYRPSYGPGAPSGLAFAISHIGNILEDVRKEQAQKAAPLPQAIPQLQPAQIPVSTMPTAEYKPLPFPTEGYQYKPPAPLTWGAGGASYSPQQDQSLFGWGRKRLSNNYRR